MKTDLLNKCPCIWRTSIYSVKAHLFSKNPFTWQNSICWRMPIHWQTSIINQKRIYSAKAHQLGGSPLLSEYPCIRQMYSFYEILLIRYSTKAHLVDENPLSGQSPYIQWVPLYMISVHLYDRKFSTWIIRTSSSHLWFLKIF